jgi:hypothetical protein
MPEKFHANNRNFVSILKGGVVSLPSTVVKIANLKAGHLYDVHMVRSRPFMLLFQEAEAGDYKLSAQGTYGGAKFTLRRLYNLHLKGRISLPIHNLSPIIWEQGKYCFGLMVEQNFWTSIPFNADAVKLLGDHEYGVYDCVDAKGHSLRIGEGLLKKRMQAHLREQWLDIVEFRHFLITDDNSIDKKADGLFYEKHFLREYKDKYGDFPKYNDSNH